uniref:aldehyde dehydrogenase family protein n=1 Tax=Pararhizobium sp. IMCC3301 TaxID=3067904 RepID=UPI0027405397|nr:aldehyde dehydrogenase family protein [Pararhizobium sp. IMCC3301]
MTYQSLNPATGKLIETFKEMTDSELETRLAAAGCFAVWRHKTHAERVAIVAKVAALMLEHKESLACTMSLEMGKRIADARGEVAFSAAILNYYATNAERFLASVALHPSKGEAHMESSPIVVIFAVEPWNFPHYQLARVAGPHLMAGNVLMVKHAGNVPQCAIAFKALWAEAGALVGLYTNLLISYDQANAIIDDPRVRGVALTGSAAAGRKIAARAGQNLKPSSLVPVAAQTSSKLAMRTEMPGMSHGTASSDTEGMGDAHRAMLWPHYVAMMLGFWMITAPFTLGYLSDFVPDANQLWVMANRGLSPFAYRNMLMTISDVGSGVLVVIFGYLSANARWNYPWAQWANAVVGGWLLFAPLVIWTPLPEAYVNSTLIGGTVIALAILIPMMPGMSMAGMMDKPDIPPEWGYNPSSWLQRVPIATLALLGFLIVLLGIVSIYFVIVQPILIGTWCMLCLFTALAMALMIPYSLDEFVAMGQFLTASHRAGKPFWRTFWTGGAMEEGSDDHARGLLAPKAQMFAQSGQGVTFPPALLAICAIGIWLTFTRLTFGSTGAMTNSDHLTGLLLVTFSIIAFAEVACMVWFLSVPAGLWLIVAPWVLDGA